MIISYLREKRLCKKKDRAKHAKFINNTDKKSRTVLSVFSICFGHGVLLITIDLKDFEFYQGRLLPIDW